MQPNPIRPPCHALMCCLHENDNPFMPCVGFDLLPTPPGSGATALIDYDRLRPEVEAVPGARFNLPLLRRKLGTLRVTNTILITSSPDDQSLVDVAARLGFHSFLADASAGNWMSHALVCEQARARDFSPRDLVLVGAMPEDAEAIRALRGGAASVTAINWPRAFDLELVWMASKCISLSPDFVINPATIFGHLLNQAT